MPTRIYPTTADPLSTFDSSQSTEMMKSRLSRNFYEQDRQCWHKRYSEMRSRNHCCRRKEVLHDLCLTVHHQCR